MAFFCRLPGGAQITALTTVKLSRQDKSATLPWFQRTKTIQLLSESNEKIKENPNEAHLNANDECFRVLI